MTVQAAKHDVGSRRSAREHGVAAGAIGITYWLMRERDDRRLLDSPEPEQIA